MGAEGKSFWFYSLINVNWGIQLQLVHILEVSDGLLMASTVNM